MLHHGPGGTTHTQLQTTSATSVRTLSDYAATTHGGIVQGGSRQSSFQPFAQGATGVSTGIDYSNEEVYHGGMRVIGEQIIEHEVRVPRKVMREEIIEKTIVVPEKVMREEIIEETQKVRETIIKVEKPVYYDKHVEVPVIETVEKIVEQEQIQIVYNERPVEKIEVREVTVTRTVPHEVIKKVEYDVPQIVEVPQLKVVEVPEVKIVYQDVPKPVDQYVTVDVPVTREVEVFHEVARMVPVGVEHVTHQTYNLPQLEEEVEEIPYPVFVPKFTEVPVAADQMTEESKLQAQSFARQVMVATAQQMPSLCLLENLATQARQRVPEFETNPQVLQQRYEEKIRQANANAEEQ